MVIGQREEKRRPEIQPERSFDVLVDSVRDYAIFLLDRDGRVATWNTGAQLIKGYEPSEIIGKTIHQFYPPEDRETGKPERLLTAARDRGRVEDEGWRVRKDGSRFWADVVISATRDESGEVNGFVKVTRDLTERRRVEEERIHQEERFRLLVESARDYAIFMLDPTGRVATWNAGAERIKGYTAADIVGRPFSLFYPPQDVANGKCKLELDGALADGRFEDEGWRVRKDGTTFWANVVITALYDRTGRHIGFSKITRDLTERRSAALSEIDLARANEALRLRDDFLSIASHELRTPLMALQLQIDSLRANGASNLEAKQVSKLDRAGRNIERLVELIGTLLDVSRISRGKLALAPRPIDFSATVAEAADRLHESAAAAHNTIRLDLEEGITGHWDPLRVDQIVSNLLSNAFKYAAGTDIDVQVRREGSDAVLRIADRGPGIPAAEIERVFGRFERAAPTRHFAGLGLGLYLAREIVSAHGGTIHANPRDGGGAELEVRMPINDTSATPKEPM